MKPVVFVVSHNNAREGAPRLCAKLAAALHRMEWFDRVFLCALAQGACPEKAITVVDRATLIRQVRSYLSKGVPVRLLLSTVICTRQAANLRLAIAPTESHDFRVVGLVHEVRNETFSWLKPRDLSSIDRLAFVAQYTSNSYGPDYAPDTKREVIHNWLSAAERRLIDEIPEKRNQSLVLVVGVVAKHKGQLHLARAFAEFREKHPDYRMALVGHVYDTEYAKLVKMLDPEAIVIMGNAEHRDVIRMMRECTIFLHGSPMESCCLSIMEAMFCKCPVVATRVGGIPEEISDGVDGLLYEYDDHRACSDLLNQLASSVSLRLELGAAARRTVVERFSEDDKLAAYKELLE